MIVTRENANGLLDAAVDPSLWTAIIPAAGRGTRLGFDQPKILFPIAGKTILEWLIDLLQPLCGRFVLVLSPTGRDAVAQMIPKNLPCEITVQHEPRGMADAIRCALWGRSPTCPVSNEEKTLIIWGDQVALRRDSLEFAMRIHQGPTHPDATIPTLWRDNPYIHFERDNANRVIRVLQAREGDSLPQLGESDSGVFLFETRALRETLPRLLTSPDCIGRKTHELNFLPILPMLDNLITVPIMTEAESVGVNSAADADYLARHLAGA